MEGEKIPTVQQDEQEEAKVKNTPVIEEKHNWTYKLTHVDNFRRNLIATLWGGGCAGAVTGYCVSVLKGAPIQLYMTSMTMTFGVGSMVFYGCYHYLQKGLGNSVWSWMISGAATGIVGGLLTNPRYLPFTTFCFTGIGFLGYATYRGLNHYYNMKRLRLKQEQGIITDEERKEMEDMRIIKKRKLPNLLGKIEK